MQCRRTTCGGPSLGTRELWESPQFPFFTVWHTMYMRILRTATGQLYLNKGSGFPLADAEVIGISGRPPLATVFHASRIRHWRRVILYGSDSLRAYIWTVKDAKGSWYSLLEESFDWLRSFCHKLAGSPPFSQDPGHWESIACFKVDPIPTYIRLATEANAKYVARKASVKAWQQCIDCTFRAAGVHLLDNHHLPRLLRRDDDKGGRLNGPCMTHTCTVQGCGKSYGSRRSLMSHFYKKHRKKCPIRARMDSEVCPCCLMCFQSRENAIFHVAHASVRCRLYVLSWLPCLDEAVRVGLDADCAAGRRALKKAGFHPRATWVPAHRADGPRDRLAQGLAYMPKAECRLHLDECEGEVVSWPEPQEEVSGDGSARPAGGCGSAMARHFGMACDSLSADSVPSKCFGEHWGGGL